MTIEFTEYMSKTVTIVKDGKETTEKLWLQDTYVKRWLTGLSEGTRDDYPDLFEDWLTFLNMTPTEIINQKNARFNKH